MPCYNTDFGVRKCARGEKNENVSGIIPKKMEKKWKKKCQKRSHPRNAMDSKICGTITEHTIANVHSNDEKNGYYCRANHQMFDGKCVRSVGTNKVASQESSFDRNQFNRVVKCFELMAPGIYSL